MHPWITVSNLVVCGSISKWPLDRENVEVTIMQLICR